MSYRQKIIAAFASLCALMLLQSLIAYLLIDHAQKLENRSLIAQEILVAYTNISSDKQRLKVWYAEYLLTQKALDTTRDILLARIQKNILKIRTLLPIQKNDLLETSKNNSEEIDVLSIIEVNFTNFKKSIYDRNFNNLQNLKNESKAFIWNEMLQTFDMSASRDVRILLNNAIEIQQKISEQSTKEANRAIQMSNIARLIMLLITISLAMVLAWYFVKLLKKPIDDLMLGTAKIQESAADSLHAIYVPVRGKDEFGILAKKFNDMSQEIFTRRNDDKARNFALEHAVNTRTAELTKANDNLQQIDLTRRQFFSDISHELRTPATVILGEAEIALRGQDKNGDDYRLTLDRIIISTKQLVKRINDLLILSNSKIAHSELNLSRCDVLEISKASIDVARAISVNKDISITNINVYYLNEKENTIKNLFFTDEDKFIQLLTIFYDNAVRYTVKGAITTNLFYFENDFKIEIVDTGIGINVNDINHIFNRDYRGHNARVMRSDGAGLGLSIAKQIAEALNLNIDIVANDNGGCTAKIESNYKKTDQI